MGKWKYLTITEAARELGISRAAVFKAIKQRRLKAEWGETVQVRHIKKRIRLIPPKAIAAYRVSMLHKWVGEKTD